jgi:hypothetical protein
MTTQQAKTIQRIEAAHEAQRFQADQAAREQAQLIEDAVIIAVQVKIEEGRMAEARQIWLDYKKGT